MDVPSDTDLVITMPFTYDDETRKRSLFQLAALMRSAHVTPFVQVIHRARVPVISFQTVPDLGKQRSVHYHALRYLCVPGAITHCTYYMRPADCLSYG